MRQSTADAHQMHVVKTGGGAVGNTEKVPEHAAIFNAKAEGK